MRRCGICFVRALPIRSWPDHARGPCWLNEFRPRSATEVNSEDPPGLAARRAKLTASRQGYEDTGLLYRRIDCRFADHCLASRLHIHPGRDAPAARLRQSGVADRQHRRKGFSARRNVRTSDCLSCMSLAAASNARTHRAAADNRSPRENPSGVGEKLSFAASSYTAHLRL
jgi:hypothetical protein